MSLYENAFKLAKQDKNFLADMAKAPNNQLPGFWLSDIEMACWATVYYGYLLGKHGVDKAEEMRNKARSM